MEINEDMQLFYNHFFNLNFKHNHQFTFKYRDDMFEYDIYGVILEDNKGIQLIIYLSNKNYAQYAYSIIREFDLNPGFLKDKDIISNQEQYVYDFTNTNIISHGHFTPFIFNGNSFYYINIDSYGFKKFEINSIMNTEIIFSNNVFSAMKMRNNQSQQPNYGYGKFFENVDEFEILNTKVKLKHIKNIMLNEVNETVKIEINSCELEIIDLIKNLFIVIFSLCTQSTIYPKSIRINFDEYSQYDMLYYYKVDNLVSFSYDIIFNIDNFVKHIKENENNIDFIKLREYKDLIISFISTYDLDYKHSFIVRYGIIELLITMQKFPNIFEIKSSFKKIFSNLIDEFVNIISRGLEDVKDKEIFIESKKNLLNSTLYSKPAKILFKKFFKENSLGYFGTKILSEDIDKITLIRNDIVHRNFKIKNIQEVLIQNSKLGSFLLSYFREFTYLHIIKNIRKKYNKK